MMRRVALLVVSSVAPALGCGGGAGGDGGDVPFNRLAAEYAAAFCHKNFVCCDPTETGVAEADIPTAEALCRTNLANEWAPFLAPYAPLIAQGRIIYHGDRARLCFDEIAAKPCAESGNSGDLGLYPHCLQIYEGTIAIGGACTLSEECAGGICGSTGVCEAQRQIGDPCAGDACPSGLACVRDSSAASSVCGAPLADGATCSHDYECASRFCEASVCGPPTMCNGV